MNILISAGPRPPHYYLQRSPRRGPRPATAVLAAALREGLLQQPGLTTLTAMFEGPVARRLEEALTDLLVQAEQHFPGLPAPRVRAELSRPLAEAAAALELLLRAVRPSAAQFEAAARALARAQRRLLDHGFGASLAVAVLYHLRLHVALDASTGTPTALAQEAQRWGEQTLAEWRQWSDGRFGPIHCVDWAPEQRFCRAMGYRFAGRSWQIRYVIDRLQHQQREWEALSARLLNPLLRSITVWQNLDTPAEQKLRCSA